MVNNGIDNSYQNIRLSKYIVLLAMLYTVVTIAPSVLLYRLIMVGQLILPGGMFIFPAIYILTDIIAEVYGYKVARLFIWVSLINNFIFTLFIFSAIYLPYPSGSQIMYKEYIDVFHGLLRSNIANLVGVILSRFINAYVITKWKILVKGRLFIIRSFCANIIGNIVMLIFWAPLALGGVVNNKEMVLITCSDFLIRAIYALLGSIPGLLIVNYLKSHEHIDVYDIGTNFNPFRLSINDSE